MFLTMNKYILVYIHHQHKYLFVFMGCPNKSARFKLRALLSLTTQQSRGGHLPHIVFQNYSQCVYFILK